MTNKILKTFIRSIGRSYCTAADQSMSFNLTHIGLIDNRSIAHLDVCGEKPVILSSRAAFTVMDGGRERDSWRWIKLEREDAGGRVFRNRMKALFEKRKMGWITRD